MKRIYQYLVLTGLSGLLCLFLAIPADAQRGGAHSGGGGGGGGRSSGGGGGGGGFSGGSRGGGFSGGGPNRGNISSGRPSGGFSGNRGEMHQQGSMASPRTNQNQGGPNRGNYSYRGSNAYGSPNRSYNNRVGGNYRGNNGSTIARSRGGFYNRGGRYNPGRSYAYRGGSRFYGRNYGPWGRTRGFYYNRGFYRSLYYPRLGFGLGVLPYGYYPFYWGGLQFYYSDGYYYQYDNNQYTVVEPPVGAAINTLPDKAEPITINGEQYYELNGVYYQPITKDDGSVVYEIAGKDGQLDTSNPDDMPGPTIEEPQIGDIVGTLPPDTRGIKLNGVKYFVSPDDYYYQETRDNNGSKAYKVVGTPTDEPGN